MSPAERKFCIPFAGVSFGEGKKKLKKRQCQVSHPAVFSLGEKYDVTSVLLQKHFWNRFPCSPTSYQNPTHWLVLGAALSSPGDAQPCPVL